MNTYPIHTLETAPEGSRPALRQLHEAFGLIPNLAATMANSPPLVNSFVSASGQFTGGTLSGSERQILLLSNAVANSSAWATAFHSTMALEEGVEPDDVDAVRQGRPPARHHATDPTGAPRPELLAGPSGPDASEVAGPSPS